MIRKTIKFQKTKSININDLKVDITQKVASASSTVDKINVFNETISRIIDMHALLVTRHIAIRPNKQWLNNDIREAKKIQKAAEKRWRKTGLNVQRQIFSNARNYTHKLVNKAKRDHLRQKICENKNNSKELIALRVASWNTQNRERTCQHQMILKKWQRLFSNYFIDKIDRIRKELDESGLSPKNDTCVT